MAMLHKHQKKGRLYQLVTPVSVDDLREKGYIGTVLYNPDSSTELVEHVRKLTCTCVSMDNCGIPAMPYLAAWKSDRKRMWYEYASPKLSELFLCSPEQVAECIRESVVDRREYNYTDSVSARIEEKIITRRELRAERLDLRRRGVRQGGVEAIYKIKLKTGALWLKDQSVIVKFPQDNIYLSPGCLTDVTKEMEQKELLERIGYYDELTGLPRRTIMDRIVEINVAQFCRGHLKDFCFILIDIDHFKVINDTFGHQAGDYVLSTMAGLMSRAKRKEDELGRYGGEEFYGICQGGLTTGVEFTERLRRIISEHCFTYGGKRIYVHFSAGVASAGELKNVTEEAIIELADRRLYIAKSQGRNRTVGCGG